MKLQPRFLGQPIQHAEFKRGDLVLFDDGSSTRLVLGGQDGDGVCGLVLNEWNATYPTECPTQVNAALLNTGGKFMQRIDDSVSVEPLAVEPAYVFGVHTSEKKNGTLCVLGDGQLAIRVRFHEHIGIWNLKSGERMDLRSNPPHQWVAAWRMVWRFDGDAITLCEFGRQTAKS